MFCLPPTARHYIEEVAELDAIRLATSCGGGTGGSSFSREELAHSPLWLSSSPRGVLYYCGVFIVLYMYHTCVHT